MKLKTVLIAMLFCTFPLSGHADTRQDQLEALRGRLTNLQHQRINLTVVQEAVLAEEQRHDVQEPAIAQQVQETEQLIEHINTETSRYDTTVQAHNSQCGGTFTDATFVNRCNQRKNDLDAWGGALQNRVQEAERQYSRVNAQVDTFNQEASDIERRKTENERSLAAVNSRIEAVQTSIRLLQLDDSFLNDPRARNQRSQSCLQLADEAMAQCMQSVFDGARP